MVVVVGSLFLDWCFVLLACSVESVGGRSASVWCMKKHETGWMGDG
jgi:hypothetical protein